MNEKYVAPTLNSDAFHCPHCEVFAHQSWFVGAKFKGGYSHLSDDKRKMSIIICERCRDFALWLDEAMIFPISSIAPLPADDMPKEIKDDYIEARNIVNMSPRAASALLRLALQKLVTSLGEKDADLNKAIGNLVKRGLPVTIQQELDCVRVIGNNAVHPGELNLKDDSGTAVSLFGLMNMIVDVMITQPKKVKELYEKIPKGAKEAIDKRDKIA